MCKYCDDKKLNLLIESTKIWNMIWFFVGKNKGLEKGDVEEDDNSVILDIRNNRGYLRLGDRRDMNCLDHGEKIEINYCPMCGRKLGVGHE